MFEGGREPVEAMPTEDPPGDVDRTEALQERLFGNAVGALELYTIYLGERLGLYQALAECGAAPSSQLAARTGTTERYVREWLEHHAASELLMVDDPSAEPMARRYWLPPEHIPVLANPDDVRYEAYTGVDIVRGGRGLPQLVEAFRVGNAPPPLPWEPEGREEANRARSSTCWRRVAPCDRRRRCAASGRTVSAGPRRGVRHRLVEHRRGAGVPQHHRGWPRSRLRRHQRCSQERRTGRRG